jgi:molybdate transport system permease protein
MRGHRARSAGFTLLLGACLVAALAFLFIPVVALFAQVPLRDLPTLLSGHDVKNAIRVTLETNAVANVLILAVGTPAAYFLATRRFRGRSLVITMIELPLVLPPAVAGIGLLAAFGTTNGMVGRWLAGHGIVLPFTEAAVVVAIIFVAAPFYLRQAIVAFEAVDTTLVAAARTLGSSPAAAFRRIALPLAVPGLAAGWALAFARGIGEFGATLLFAGNVRGITQTLPLAVYEQLELNYDVALALGVLLVCISAAILIAYKMLAGWASSPSTSPGASAATSSP